MDPLVIVSIISFIIVVNVIFYKFQVSNYKSEVTRVVRILDCKLLEIVKAPSNDRGGLKTTTKISFVSSDSKPKPTMFFKVKFTNKGREYFAHCKVAPTNQKLSVIFEPHIKNLIG